MEDFNGQVSIASPTASNGKNIGKYQSNTIIPKEDSQLKKSINWGNFYNQATQQKSSALELKQQISGTGVQLTGKAKRRKFQMKQLKDVVSQQSSRYSVSRTERYVILSQIKIYLLFVN